MVGGCRKVAGHFVDIARESAAHNAAAANKTTLTPVKALNKKPGIHF